jgi:excisionase family DNA binding protein
MEILQTKIVTVSLDDLQIMMSKVVRTELETLVTNPFLGVDFKDELWDRKQAADFLGISQQTLIKIVLEGKIVAQKSGRKYHFLKSSIISFLRVKTEY